MRITLLGLVFLAACGGNSRNGPDASGPPDDASGGGGGAACGGPMLLSCAATEYCDYADNGCGIGDRTGTCKPRPDKCPLILARPTCACDGQIYQGDCIAYRAGVDLNAHGTCDLPQGSFACGYVQCTLANSYCERLPQASAADAYTCIGLPAACTAQPATCMCLAGETCGKTCAGNATVGLTLTCPTASQVTAD